MKAVVRINLYNSINKTELLICSPNAYSQTYFFSVFTVPMLKSSNLHTVFLFCYFIQSQIFCSTAYLTVANLARLRISVHCQVSVRSQHLVKLHCQCSTASDYRLSHKTHTYRRIVTPNWYLTHTVPKFSLQSSWITVACHYTWLLYLNSIRKTLHSPYCIYFKCSQFKQLFRTYMISLFISLSKHQTLQKQNFHEYAFQIKI